MTHIVVGVDGSSGSRAALRWAADEAAAHGGDLTAVMAWEYEMFGVVPGDAVAVPQGDRTNEIRERLARIVAEELGDRAGSVTVEPAYGTPSSALLAQSDGADLLVVGSRGLGGFKRLLLGSVSTQVVHHATVPVVVVPHPEGPDD